MRTTPNIGTLLEPLEQTINTIFIPALLNRTCTDVERDIYALPVKLGGLGIFKPSEICDQEYGFSQSATEPLVNTIFEQEQTFNLEYLSAEVTRVKKEIKVTKANNNQSNLAALMDKIPPDTKRMLELATEKGSSCWLTSLPLSECDFVMNKQEFRDALCLRYNYHIKDIPKHCACGQTNSIDHTLICKKGGFVSMRHNQIRNLEAHFLSEVCRDVNIEPPLLPLTGETFSHRSANTAAGARLDVSARGVWNPMDKVFFDIRIFHPGADSNKNHSPSAMYKKHENEKKRTYNSRIIEVEKSTFTPLVFSTSGGMGEEADSYHKRIASLISEKRGSLYSDAISYMRRRLRFCILRTTLIALRGYRGKKSINTAANLDDLDMNLIPAPFNDI